MANEENPFAEFLPKEEENPFAEFVTPKKKLGEASIPNYLSRRPSVVSGGYIPQGVVAPSEFVGTATLPDVAPLDDKMQPVRDFLKNPETGKIRETRISSGTGSYGDPFTVSSAFDFDEVYKAAPNGAVFKTPDGEIVERKASLIEGLVEPLQAGLEKLVGSGERIAGDFLNIPNEIRESATNPNYRELKAGYPASSLPVDQSVANQVLQAIAPMNFGDGLNQSADSFITSGNDRLAKVKAGGTPLRGGLGDITEAVVNDPEGVVRNYAPDVVASIPAMLGMVTGNPTTALGIASGASGVESYGQDRLEGRGMGESAQNAAVQTALEAVFEKLPIDAVLKPSTNSLAKAGKVIATETLTEGLTGPSQYVATQNTRGEKIEKDKLQDSLVDSLVAGFGMSGPLATAGVAVDKFSSKSNEELKNAITDTFEKVQKGKEVSASEKADAIAAATVLDERVKTESKKSPPLGEATAETDVSKATAPPAVEPTQDLDALIKAKFTQQGQTDETGRNDNAETYTGSPANPNAEAANQQSANPDAQANQADSSAQATNQQAGAVRKPFVQPDEVAAGEFVAKAAELGVSPEAAQILAPKASRDGVTGFVDGQASGVKASTMKRAIDHVAATGEESHFVSADIFNLGGLNKHHGNVASKANVDYRAMANILSDELQAAGADIVPMRTGGDEFGVIAVNISQANLDAATARAQAKIEQYAKDNGLTQVENPKGGQAGVGVHIGTANIQAGSTVDDVFNLADIGVDESKNARAGNVTRSETGTTRAVAPQGQAAGIVASNGGTESPNQRQAGNQSPSEGRRKYVQKVIKGKPVTRPGKNGKPVPVMVPTIDYKNDTLLHWLGAAGGINFDNVGKQIGIDKALFKDRLNRPFGIAFPVLRRNGGMTLDETYEKMKEDGWLLPDSETGQARDDASAMEDMLMDALAGRPVYHPYEGRATRDSATQDARQEEPSNFATADELAQEEGFENANEREAFELYVANALDREQDIDADRYEEIYEAAKEIEYGTDTERARTGEANSGRVAEDSQGLFAQATAQETVEAERRKRDADRDGKTGAGRTDMLSGDGELFAGKRPDQDDLGGSNYSLNAGSANGLSNQEVVRVAVRVLGDNPDQGAVPVLVVDSAEQLPQAIRDDMEANDIPDNEVRGVHWRGKSYLVADKLTTEAEVEEVIFHEHYTHGGLRAKYGNRLSDVLADLVKGVGGLDGLRKLASDQKIDLSLYEETVLGNPKIAQKFQVPYLMEELLAHMSASTGKLRRVIEEYVGAIRAWLRSNKFPGLSEYGVTDLANVLKQAREATLEKSASNSSRPFYQRVFHGTHARGINKFSLEKMGTGEGAQAFGWGMYFASSQEIAEHYRKNVTDSFGGPAKKDTSSFITRQVGLTLGDLLDKNKAEIDRLEQKQEEIDGNPEYFKDDYIKKIKGELAAYKKRRDEINSEIGQTYKVEIPEDSDLMDWDKPLSEQPEKAQPVLRSMWHKAAKSFSQIDKSANPTVGQIHHLYTQHRGGNAKAFADEMNDAGVVGLKYLDSNSRGSDGEKTSNYVIWDESAIGEPEAMYSRSSDDQTETAAFKKWFGESKVVDADGKPLVVYHGTGADFSEFKVDGAGKTSGSGAFFTDNSKTADTYAVGDSPSVSPVFLSLKYPVIVDAQGQNWSKIKQSAKVYLPEIAAVTKSMQLDEDLLAALEDRKPEKLNPVKSKEKNTSVKSLFKNELDYSDDTVSTDDLARWARQNGYDGIIIKNVMDRGPSGRFSSDEAQKPSTLYVAFNPSQIKSATGNSGAFDAGNPDIRYSRKPDEARADAESKRNDLAQTLPTNRGTAGWNYDASRWEGRKGWLRKQRADLQDKMVSWKYLLEDLNKVIPDAENVYRLETLMHGRVADRMDTLERESIVPLVEAMRRAKVDVAALEQYLYARHAKERNEHIADINPSMPDYGSGMGTDEAAKILADAKPVMATLAKQVDKMLADTRRRMLDAGLITQEQFNSLNSQYKHYIPLRGKKTEANDFDADMRRTAGGGGVDTRGSMLKTAMGRGKGNLAENLLAEVIGDAQRSIIMAEKARVGRAVMRVVLANPNHSLWEVEPVQTERKLDANGEVYEAVINDWSDPRVIAVKHKGQLYKVSIADEQLAKALNHVGVEKLGEFTRIAGKMNRYFSSVLTQYNPAFIPVNATRDAIFGLTALAAEKGEGTALKVAAHYAQAIWAMQRHTRGVKGNNAYDVWADEFAKAGGQTGYVNMPSIEDITDAIGKGRLGGYSPTGIAKAGRVIADAVGTMNTAVENALRLSTYVELRKQGASQEAAAEYAKNLTVNFNKKGFNGSAINSWFLFYNAALQGAVRSSQVMRKPKTWGYLGAMAAAQVAATMFAMGLRDDDDEPIANKIPDHVKRRNLWFVIPGEAGEHTLVTIPLPYGFNVFPYIAGRTTSAMMNEEQKPDETAAELTANSMSALIESFMPVPLAKGPVGMLPYPLTIAANVQTNRDDFGRPIRQEDPYAKSDLPRSSIGKPDTMEIFKITAKGLNRLGGGDDETVPSISFLDLAPEDLEYMSKAITGGAGKFVIDVAATGGNMIDQSAPEIGPDGVPIVKRYVSKVNDQQAQRSMYYERRAAIDKSTKKLRKIFEVEGLEAAQQYLDTTPALIGARFDTRKNEGKGGQPAGSVILTDGKPKLEVGIQDSPFGKYKAAEKALSGIRDEIEAQYNAVPASIIPNEKSRKRDAEIRRLEVQAWGTQYDFNKTWNRDVVDDK